MDARECINNQLTNNRQFAELMFDDITEEERFESAGGAVNHILWLAGHLAFSDSLVLAQLKSPVDFDEEWRRLFSGGHELIENRDEYPSMAEVRSVLYDYYAKIQDALDKLSDDELAEEIITHSGTKIARYKFVLGLCAHESYHLGQAAIIRRGLGRKRLI